MSGDAFLGFNTAKSWDYENGFYLTSPANRICKLLAQYELYKTIIDLPGHIVECGVFKGTSLIRFATFREALESPVSRKIIGFDAFGKFPRQGDGGDITFANEFESAGGQGISKGELEKVLAHKQFTNYDLVEGDILQTLPKYVEEHPELKIALLHIDVDIYEPSKVALNLLYDRVVRGGLVVFDDYGTVAGETRAVDEFLRGKDVVIKKLPISHIPSYLRK